MDRRTPVLEVDRAAVRLEETTLLPPISLVAGRGELWAISGPNGSGKTTLLRAIIGSRELTEGACSLFGEPVDMSRPTHRRSVASVVDPMPIARDMTVHEQVLMVAASWFAKTPEAADRTDRIIEQLRLGDLRHRFPHQLSSGQQQLFTLALALVRPADLLLLDEPERHLDDDRLSTVAKVLAERATSGVAVVAATHERTLLDRAHHRIRLD